MVRISDCSSKPVRILSYTLIIAGAAVLAMFIIPLFSGTLNTCLLYTSDAADE